MKSTSRVNLFKNISWLVGTAIPKLVYKKQTKENIRLKYGYLRDIRRFHDQSIKVLVKEDKRFKYPLEYNLKNLEQDDYCIYNSKKTL